MKFKVMIGAAVTVALLVVAMAAITPDFGGAAVLAQTPTVVVPTTTVPTTSTPTSAPVKEDNSGKWGLLGLLGLAGLAGLLKRPHTEVRTVETPRVDPMRVDPPRNPTR